MNVMAFPDNRHDAFAAFDEIRHRYHRKLFLLIRKKSRTFFFLSNTSRPFLRHRPANGKLKFCNSFLVAAQQFYAQTQKRRPKGRLLQKFELERVIAYSSALNSEGKLTLVKAFPSVLNRCAAPAGAEAVTVSPIFTRLCPGARTVTRSPLASFR